MTSVLITGIGGTRSIAVLKALRMNSREFNIVGTDMNYFNAGSFQCDKAYVIPRASDPEYLTSISNIITSENIKIIFATVEKEVSELAKLKKQLESKFGVSVLVPDSQILEKCMSKYETQVFLREAGFAEIPTIYADDRKQVEAFAKTQGYPLIRKPEFGYGSKGLSIMNDQDALNSMELDKNFVLQRHINNSDTEKLNNLELNEYTAEVLINKDGNPAGGIIIKRALFRGETLAGHLIHDSKILEYLTKVALKTGILGPINFQFRIENNQPYIFEINPLFSGTTAVRAELGFNSVQLAVDSFVNGQHRKISPDHLSEKYFMRYLQEIFINPSDLRMLRDEKVIGLD